MIPIACRWNSICRMWVFSVAAQPAIWIVAAVLVLAPFCVAL